MSSIDVNIFVLFNTLCHKPVSVKRVLIFDCSDADHCRCWPLCTAQDAGIFNYHPEKKNVDIVTTYM